MTDEPTNETPAVDPVPDTKLPLEPVDTKPKKTRVGFFSRLRRESKRDRQIASLSDGYQQMVDLMGSIQLHLESQTQSQKYLLNAMEHLPEVADGIQKMGTAAEKQTEVLGLMREQLDSSVTHDKQLVDSMKRFNKTLAAMNVIFFILLVAGLITGIYFAMSTNARTAFVDKTKEVFSKGEAPIEAVVEDAILVESNEVGIVVCPETEEACSNETAVACEEAEEAEVACSNDTAVVCDETAAVCSNETEVVSEEMDTADVVEDVVVDEAVDAEMVPVVVAEDELTVETVVEEVVVPVIEALQEEAAPISEAPDAM